MIFSASVWLTPARLIWIIAAIFGVVGLILFTTGAGKHSRRSDSGLLGMLFVFIGVAMAFLGGLAYAVTG